MAGEVGEVPQGVVEVETGPPSTEKVIDKFLHDYFSPSEISAMTEAFQPRIYEDLAGALGSDYSESFQTCKKLSITDSNGRPTRTPIEMCDYMGYEDAYQAMLKRIELAANIDGNPMPPDFFVGRFEDPREFDDEQEAAYYRKLYAFEYRVPGTENEKVSLVLENANQNPDGKGPMFTTRVMVYFDGQKYHRIYDSEEDKVKFRYRLFNKEGSSERKPKIERPSLNCALKQSGEIWSEEIEMSGAPNIEHEFGHHKEREHKLADRWILDNYSEEGLDIIRDSENGRGRVSEDVYKNSTKGEKTVLMVYKNSVVRSERKAWVSALLSMKERYANSALILDEASLKAYVSKRCLASYGRGYSSIPTRLEFTEKTSRGLFVEASHDMMREIDALFKEESERVGLSYDQEVWLRKAALLGILATKDDYKTTGSAIEALERNIEDFKKFDKDIDGFWGEAWEMVKEDLGEAEDEKLIGDQAWEHCRDMLRSDGIDEDQRDLAWMSCYGYLGHYVREVKD